MSRDRREFPRAVKAQIIKRAMDPKGNISCEGCGLKLGKKPWHIDHTKPDALEIDKSRPLTAEEGRLLGWDCCHKPKTADDVAKIARAKRRESRHLGIKKRSTFACARSGPFKAKIGGGVVPRYVKEKTV